MGAHPIVHSSSQAFHECMLPGVTLLDRGLVGSWTQAGSFTAQPLPAQFPSPLIPQLPIILCMCGGGGGTLCIVAHFVESCCTYLNIVPQPGMLGLPPSPPPLGSLPAPDPTPVNRTTPPNNLIGQPIICRRCGPDCGPFGTSWRREGWLALVSDSEYLTLGV